MNKFLDTSIIIGYANDEEKFVLFAKNKKEEFIICYYTLEREIPSIKKRLKLIIDEIKKQSPSIRKLIENKDIYKQDLFRAEKLLALKESLTKKGLDSNKYLDKIQELFELRMDFFVQNLINKKVIAIKEINFKLKSSLFTYTNNHSDANILASGIQYHQENNVILVTSDKKDWTKENLEWALPEFSELRKKYQKIPEIEYV